MNSSKKTFTADEILSWPETAKFLKAVHLSMLPFRVKHAKPWYAGRFPKSTTGCTRDVLKMLTEAGYLRSVKYELNRKGYVTALAVSNTAISPLDRLIPATHVGFLPASNCPRANLFHVAIAKADKRCVRSNDVGPTLFFQPTEKLGLPPRSCEPPSVMWFSEDHVQTGRGIWDSRFHQGTQHSPLGQQGNVVILDNVASVFHTVYLHLSESPESREIRDSWRVDELYLRSAEIHFLIGSLVVGDKQTALLYGAPYTVNLPDSFFETYDGGYIVW